MGSLVALVLLFAAGCTDERLSVRCDSDEACDTGQRCYDGRCGCASDASCATGEFCNRAGDCQARVGCETSLDCAAGEFCDRLSGTCLEADFCTDDIHCALGEVCDRGRFRCVAGCRETGDCPLGNVCRCADEGISCVLGRCEENGCDDDSFCRFGERCLEGDDGRRACRRDERGPFCEGCQYTPGSFTRCPGAETDANFCLLDRKVSYRRTYCGVDCSAGQACPWGFSCRDILILTGAFCQDDAECPANGPACASDVDCPAGRCAANGRCGGKCSFNEDSKQGFCTCSADAECPRDSCEPGSRRCRITKRPCSIDGDECSRAIYCVNKGDRAACLIGKNCVPSEGITCDDIP